MKFVKNRVETINDRFLLNKVQKHNFWSLEINQAETYACPETEIVLFECSFYLSNYEIFHKRRARGFSDLAGSLHGTFKVLMFVAGMFVLGY